MGTSAGISFFFKNGKERWTYTHYGGHHNECGKKLWFFLRALTAEKWTTLENQLQNQVKWVEQHDQATNEDHEQYEWKYCWPEDDGKHIHLVKEIFSKLNSCPARTLEEVLEQRVKHMISHSPSDYTEYDYRVDFNTKSLWVLQEDGQTWTKVPFITDQVVDELFNYEMEEDTWTQLEPLSCQESYLLGRFEVREGIDRQALIRQQKLQECHGRPR